MSCQGCLDRGWCCDAQGCSTAGVLREQIADQKESVATVEAEGDRLRAQLVEVRGQRDTDAETCKEALASVDSLTADLEATRAELAESDDTCATLAVKLAAAEHRVAELERVRDAERRIHARVLAASEIAHSAVDQARELLDRGRAPFENRDDYLAWEEDCDAWLSRNPALGTLVAAGGSGDEQGFANVEGWLQLEAGYFLGDCFVAMYEPEALDISYGESTVAADDSGRSFLPKHTATLPITVLRTILAPHGLGIVATAEMSTPKERALLEAGHKLDAESTTSPTSIPAHWKSVAASDASRRRSAVAAEPTPERIDADAYWDDAPYVCPGCYAVGGERCAPGCIDAEIEAEHREAIESGNYDRFDDDDLEREP